MAMVVTLGFEYRKYMKNIYIFFLNLYKYIHTIIMGTMQKPTVSIIQWDPAGEKRQKAVLPQKIQVFYSVKGRFNKNNP